MSEPTDVYALPLIYRFGFPEERPASRRTPMPAEKMQGTLVALPLARSRHVPASYAKRWGPELPDERERQDAQSGRSRPGDTPS
jgi:hypothetical protein